MSNTEGRARGPARRSTSRSARPSWPRANGAGRSFWFTADFQYLFEKGDCTVTSCCKSSLSCCKNTLPYCKSTLSCCAQSQHPVKKHFEASQTDNGQYIGNASILCSSSCARDGQSAANRLGTSLSALTSQQKPRPPVGDDKAAHFLIGQVFQFAQRGYLPARIRFCKATGKGVERQHWLPRIGRRGYTQRHHGTRMGRR